jgi:ABC-type multidrug transport system fused ATPase/permease subunit
MNIILFIMRLSYISVFIFVFLLFNVYAGPDLGDGGLSPDLGGTGIPDASIPDISPSGTVNLYEVILMDVMPLTIVLLMISAAIYSLGYMASKFLNNDKMRKRVETEIYQSFATALILFLSVSLFTVFINMSDVFMIELIRLQGLEEVYDVLTNPREGVNELTFEELFEGERPLFTEESQVQGERLLSSDSHMKYARVFLLNQLNKLDSFYQTIFALNSLTHSAFGKVFASASKYLGGFFTITALKQSVFGYIFYGFFFTYMQLAVLDLIKMFFYFMFPWGIFLRSFSLTNSVGSAMIAMSIGLYFIYPTILGILLISNYDTLQLEPDEFVTMLIKEEPSEFIDYYLTNKLNYKQLEKEEKLKEYHEILDKDTSGMTIVERFEHEKEKTEKMREMMRDSEVFGTKLGIEGDNVSVTADMVMNFVQRILLNMYLFPLISLTATYTFIHAFSGLMQANISELGRGLIRLI